MVIDRCFSVALDITGSDITGSNISSTQQNCYDINLSGSCSKTYPLLLLPSCLLSLSLTLLWPWRQGRPSPTLGRRLTTYPRRPPPPTGASASFWPPPAPTASGSQHRQDTPHLRPSSGHLGSPANWRLRTYSGNRDDAEGRCFLVRGGAAELRQPSPRADAAEIRSRAAARLRSTS